MTKWQVVGERPLLVLVSVLSLLTAQIGSVAAQTSRVTANNQLYLPLTISSARGGDVSAASVSLTTFGATYTQDFNTLASSGTSSTLPPDWAFAEIGSNANITYTAGTGSGNTGDTYSFGASGNSERAFGGLQSGSLIPTLGASFRNNTGGAITSLTIGYTGEQWRIGNTAAARDDRLDFQYSLDATSLTTGAWLDVNALDFVNPVKTAAAQGALDGNNNANRTALVNTITGLSIPAGATFWLRWTDLNATGADDGLAIDDFSLSADGFFPVTVSISASDGNAAETGSDPGAFTIARTGSTASDLTVLYSVSGSASSDDYTPLLSGSALLPAGQPAVEIVITPVDDSSDEGEETVILTLSSDPAYTVGAPNSATVTISDNEVADLAPEVSSTSPTNGAVDVASNATIQVNFSEAVNLTANAVAVECPAGTPVSFSGLPANNVTSVTLTPAAPLPATTTCAVNVLADQVSDVDANDPPDNLAANVGFGFTTAGPLCEQPYVPVYAIQGNGAAVAAAYNNQAVTTQGVVVGDYEGPTPTLRGFYLQDLSGDGNAETSDGLFVFNANNDNVSLGQVVRVTGTAAEFQEQTQLSGALTIVNCGTTATPAPVDVTLPVPAPVGGVPYLERFEGMLVRFPQTLYVTEHFQLGRFGQVTMSANDILFQPTNIVPPGGPGSARDLLQQANDRNRIIVDDELQNQNRDPILFGRGGNPLSASNTLRGGDTATGMVGVLVYTWAGNAASPNNYRLRPINALGGGAPNFQATNARPASPRDVGGNLKVTAANVLNYFNTFGNGACTFGVGGAAADCRGAESSTEFDRQAAKTVASMVGNGAAIIGLMEIENDGYGANSALQDLVTRLNLATALGVYSFVDVDTNTGQVNALGNDAIKVGLIYKPGEVTPVGATAVLNTGAFGQIPLSAGGSQQRNRPALAQAFQLNSNGERVIVVVNHLKSKGSACTDQAAPYGPDPDTGDGQGNCNLTRVAAANELTAWLATDPTGTGDPDILIMGDLNAYAQEDPVTAIKNAGYVNLIQDRLGEDAYSFAFDAQWGYLDHALASASLNSQVNDITEWHINADEPGVLDYNTNFKSAGQSASLFAPDQYRSADHDPVIIGLNLLAQPQLTVNKVVVNDNGGTQQVGDFALTVNGNSVTSGTPVSLAPGAYTVAEGSATGYSATFSGDCAADGTLTLALGEVKSCTITNDDIAPTITLVKAVPNDPTADLNSFGLSIGGAPVNSGQTVAVTANTPVAINEAGKAGYDFVGISGANCPTTLGSTVSLALDQHLTCTITNSKHDVAADTILLSSNSNGSVTGIPYRDEDILIYDPNTNGWEMLFDGSNVGLGGTDVDAFALLTGPGGTPHLLISTDSDFNLRGYGAVDDADILEFIPTSLGFNTTAGSFALWLDGSDIGLNVGGEDIDDIDFDTAGNLLISVTGAFAALGEAANDEDLLRLNGLVTGAATSATGAEIYFDGSGEALTAASEDILDTWTAETGDLYMAALGNVTTADGFTTTAGNIFRCTPVSAGTPITDCTFSLFWSGTPHGLAGQAIDGLHIGDAPALGGSTAITSTLAPLDETAGDDVDDADELDGYEAAEPRFFGPLIRR